jgi:hypothetical protein
VGLQRRGGRARRRRLLDPDHLGRRPRDGYVAMRFRGGCARAHSRRPPRRWPCRSAPSCWRR